MNLFPMFAAPAASQRADLPLYTDVAMDYDAMEPRWESGEPVIVTGLEAVKSWAVRAILTARYRWPIFDWSYGCELEALVGQPYLAETQAERGQPLPPGGPADVSLHHRGAGDGGSPRRLHPSRHGGADHRIRKGAHLCLKTGPQRRSRPRLWRRSIPPLGSPPWPAASPTRWWAPPPRRASEIYQALPAVVSMLFVDETSGGFLDLVGRDYHNLARREGTRAKCAMELTGQPGTEVPGGTVFLTATGLRFATLDPVAIGADGQAVCQLEAQDVGAAYNIQAGAITSMWVNISGLKSYRNAQAAGGTDTESDAQLYERIDAAREVPRHQRERLGLPPLGPGGGGRGRGQGGGAGERTRHGGADAGGQHLCPRVPGNGGGRAGQCHGQKANRRRPDGGGGQGAGDRGGGCGDRLGAPPWTRWSGSSPPGWGTISRP